MTKSHVISDSGCTSHFLGYHTPCDHKQPTTHGLTVSLLNGQTIRSTHTALLPFPKIPHITRQAHMFPALKHKSLLFKGQLWDHRFKAVLNDTTVQLANSNTTITGTCDLSNGLYFIYLRQPADPIPQYINSHASSAHKMTTKAVR